MPRPQEPDEPRGGGWGSGPCFWLDRGAPSPSPECQRPSCPSDVACPYSPVSILSRPRTSAWPWGQSHGVGTDGLTEGSRGGSSSQTRQCELQATRVTLSTCAPGILPQAEGPARGRQQPCPALPPGSAGLPAGPALDRLGSGALAGSPGALVWQPQVSQWLRPTPPPGFVPQAGCCAGCWHGREAPGSTRHPGQARGSRASLMV